jgi:ArsR family transcriptional regulator
VTLLLDGERCVCDLMSDLDLAQSRLSWHLKTLSDAGIITGRREGRWNYYSLNTDALAEATTILDALKPRRRLTVRSGCCD